MSETNVWKPDDRIIAASEKLKKDFPFMQNTWCGFGYGWFDLVRELCEKITAVYAEAGLEPDIVVLTVEEKYGTLRFEWGGDAQMTDEWDNDEAYRAAYSAAYEKITALASEYEDKSETVCEKCGRSGMTYNVNDWYTCLCDDCLEKEQRK